MPRIDFQLVDDVICELAREDKNFFTCERELMSATAVPRRIVLDRISQLVEQGILVESAEVSCKECKPRMFVCPRDEIPERVGCAQCGATSKPWVRNGLTASEQLQSMDLSEDRAEREIQPVAVEKVSF